jgi:hypothetical protein
VNYRRWKPIYTQLLRLSSALGIVVAMTQKTKPTQIRAYIREGITRLPLDVQKYEIEKFASDLKLRVEWYTGVASKNKSANEERDLWARQLRCSEIGVVHSLPVLRLTRKQLGGDIDPKDDFSGFVASIGGLNLVEASTGLTREDRAKWRSAVTEASSKPPPGSKPLTTAEARRIAKKGWETRNKGVRFTWRSEARELERRHLIRHWLASDTAKTALATLPEFIDDMGGGVYEELRGISASGLNIICGTRRK